MVYGLEVETLMRPVVLTVRSDVANLVTALLVTSSIEYVSPPQIVNTLFC
jgi:hypothetical protein